jgi:hypothetical protein
MDSDLELVCKIFIDSDWSREELTKIIARTVDGAVDGSMIRSATGEFDVRRNRDFDEQAR